MSSRLTSAIFVSALIRRVNGEGGFAAVVRHGSDEAGAIFICVPGGFGQGTTLFAQAPQSLFADRDTPPSGGRLFEKVADGLSPDELDAKFQREARLDPDFWVVELELFGRSASDYFDIA
ncbi:DUF1491 family protein [Oricola sp.]|uniref:DUF1491 family protein n=1 Tax=Oricola sp. TaxID=1979950 RepID=UPI003512CB71